MSHPTKPSLVGSIVERKAGVHSPPAGRTAVKTGFPAVQHRSQSAFSRARNEQKKSAGSSRLNQPPVVKPAATHDIDTVEDEEAKSQVIAQVTDDWRRQMEDENQRRVESMSPDELEEARRAIFEQFGPNIAEILQQSRAAREAARISASDPLRSDARPSRPHIDSSSRVLKSALASRAASPDPLSAGSTRPSSRLDRQIRFAELTPKDVHVYQSAPPSPPKKPLALPAPTDEDGPTISLGQWKGTVKPLPDASIGALASKAADPPPSEHSGEVNIEEGTPEDIRRRFFPTHEPHDPSLAWIEGPSESGPSSSESSALRFDLSGTPIPPHMSATLPTHLGLHHHAEGTHAGYTLEDIFLLSRSTVPAQRASMLGILAKITLAISKQAIQQLVGQESTLRKRILAVGVEAMHERGSVGVRAVEVVWSCVVAWDSGVTFYEGIESRDPSDDTLDAMPLQYVLTQISEAFETAALPQESLSQMLAIVNRIAEHSNAAASSIIDIQNLIRNLLQRFLFVQPSDDNNAQPDPLAVQILVTLALASRSNAAVIADSATSLLRFVVILPPTSPYSTTLATTLLMSTLRLFGVLASYGLGSHIATTASEHLNKLMQFVLSDACTSDTLTQAWLHLLEAWTICAIDPHRTTPEHDILWSQIVGWEWGNDILYIRRKLTRADLGIWSAVWRTEAAWLEGSSVNSVRGGESEKASAVARFGDGFERGVEKELMQCAVNGIKDLLTSVTPEDMQRTTTWQSLTQLSLLLAAAIRLWLSCIPPNSSASPFLLPFADISAVCAQLTTHPLWSMIYPASIARTAQVSLRSLSLLLSSYLKLSRVSPDVSADVWLAQAFAILCRLTPGDEEQASLILSMVSKAVTHDVVQSFGGHAGSALGEQGLEPILPLLAYSVEQTPIRVGPLWPTPLSISKSETQRLTSALERSGKGALPLPKDWLFFPLDQLLRSGDSGAFRSLPSSWDYSEVDVARSTLLLAKIHRHVLSTFQLHVFTSSREETVFSCMKVFMLEHEQQQTTSVQEVFRDTVVTQLMDDLLAPFTLSASSVTASQGSSATLEEVAKRFLGEGTPFYQYYTDFVALYDSVSFSHPLFARLLLPPLSMRYPSDYRKYLWADYNHILRTIKTPVASLVAQGLDEYLSPVESDPEVISAYLRSLVKGQLEGFLQLIAIHHIASNIWPDLQPNGGNEERAGKLLQVIVDQGDFETVRKVVYYHQGPQSVLTPPACFQESVAVTTRRRQYLESYNKDVGARLARLMS